jgi:hypothetical protein
MTSCQIHQREPWACVPVGGETLDMAFCVAIKSQVFL